MKRVLMLIGGVALAIILSKVVMENVLGIQLEPLITRWMAGAGAGSAVVMIALLAADLFLPIPSSLIMVLSGAAFGVMWGSMFSLVGSIGGEWLGFELVRRYRQRAAEKIVGDEELERLARVFDRHGMSVVVVTRALPVVMETMSVVAGLSKMSRSSFLVASLLGTAPIVVIYAYAGVISRQTGSLLPAIIMLVAVAGLGWIIYRSRIDIEEKR
ncbi:MAG TPA: VTT domain-containing protein [Vicinamibacterales bacterium]|nr:VTT domain-containing protein [Vicinamibacterales bacterium]